MGDQLDPGQQAGDGGSQSQQQSGQQSLFVKSILDDNTIVLSDGREYVPKARYTGQQGALSKAVNEAKEWKVKVADAETQLADLTAQVEQFNAGNEKFQNDLQALMDSKSQLEAQVNSQQTQMDTLQLVMTEFPDLAQPVAKGFINIGERQGDDLRAFLKEVAGEFQGQRKQGADDYGQGDTPPPPPGGGNQQPQSPGELYDQLMKMSPADQNYQPTWNAYLAALKTPDQQ